MRECFFALLSCFLAMFWNEDTLLAAVHVLVCTLDLRDNIVCGFLSNAENIDDFHKRTFQNGALSSLEKHCSRVRFAPVGFGLIYLISSRSI
jgi:hypothetical protein